MAVRSPSSLARIAHHSLSLGLVSALARCSVIAPIQPAATGKSAFQGAVYKGTAVTVGPSTPGREQYRVFQQGATGFVSLQSVRETAEQRAKEFCDRKRLAVESIEETTASPPYILGNFPRIEIVFDCVPAVDGVSTQSEFDSEKEETLSQPTHAMLYQ